MSYILQIQPSNEPNNYLGVFVILILFLGPVVFWTGKFLYTRRYDHLWEDGIFPSRLRFTRSNLMEAYICLAARMIQADTEDAGQKIIFISNYFKKRFANSNYNFSESISYSYHHPIQIRTVTRWLNMRVTDRSQRNQIIYFLAGISVIDGSMNKRELSILRKLSELLELSPKEFDRIIAMYQRKTEPRNNDYSSTKKESAIQLACRIIGVSEFASMEEIKKAYRMLVKQHHPDRFVNESEEQQEIAEERFIEIQKAYELLEKRK